MKAYLVGGAVRDALLDIPCSERDWVVTGATEQDMLDAGYTRADPDAAFPVFLHPETGEEYALARRETKTGAGYKGFAVEAGPEVTLEEDLARRDLTINAMAEDADGKLIDPFKGRDDLDAGLLRHVTPAFVEDPVRLLRIARFAAKLGCFGFKVAHGTHALMKKMAAAPDLEALKAERVWKELKRALAEDAPWRFFEVLQRCGALVVLLPDLSALLDDDAGHAAHQRAAGIAALQRAVAAGLSPELRWAVLVQGAGERLDALQQRLPVEKGFAQAARQLQGLAAAYPKLPGADAEAWLAFLEQGRALQLPEAFTALVAACAVLHPESPGDLPGRLAAAASAAAAVDARGLQSDGLSGAALGQALREARRAAVAGAV